jgi:diguanylate cyclase (GGDEF)-like protein
MTRFLAAASGMARLCALTAISLRLLALAMLPFAASAGAAAAKTPARIVIVSVAHSAGTFVYRLRVSKASQPAIVIVPDDASVATLEVNGATRQRVGYDIPVGIAPLGHAAAMMYLRDLGPADRVVVRVRGSSGGLRIPYDPEGPAKTHESGFWSGTYFAVLWIVAFFIVVAICIVRDAAMAWYLGFTVSLVAVETARDGMLPYSQAVNVWCLIGFSLISTAFILAFTASYLRLRSQAPRLLAAMIAWTAAPLVICGLFSLATHRPVDEETIVFPATIGLIACIVVAAVRRLSGYTPATFIAIGFVGLTGVFVAKIVRDVIGHPSPFLDRWSFEIGTVFDVLAFAIAVTIRSRYAERARVEIEGDLQAATYKADHDDLTGLLNRRGLEARFEKLNTTDSTVLFVDLDGFKTINDRGGHAAGDDALKIVSRILRHAVRPDDVVARVGGDEFIVMLVGCLDRSRVDEVMARITSAVSFVSPLGSGDPTRFGVSIGHAVAERGETFAAAMAGADADAYRVKGEHYARARELRRLADPNVTGKQ